jgi:hypothetical protein
MKKNISPDALSRLSRFQQSLLFASLGGTLYIGMQNNAGGDQIFKGKVAEVVVYSRVLTTQERQQVEAYLNTKYAIY